MVAEGTPAELKRVTDGARLDVTLASPHPGAADALREIADGPLRCGDDGRHISVPVRVVPGLVTRAVRALDDAGIELEDVALHQPSLDDVFMQLTGGVREMTPAVTR